MKFFDWLFGKGWDGSEDTVGGYPIEDEFKVDPKKFRPVPKWTHPGKKGKDIYCPKCGNTTHVFHFGWDALRCQFCQGITDKYAWLLPVRRGRKKEAGGDARDGGQ